MLAYLLTYLPEFRPIADYRDVGLTSAKLADLRVGTPPSPPPSPPSALLEGVAVVGSVSSIDTDVVSAVQTVLSTQGIGRVPRVVRLGEIAVRSAALRVLRTIALIGKLEYGSGQSPRGSLHRRQLLSRAQPSRSFLRLSALRCTRHRRPQSKTSCPRCFLATWPPCIAV